MFSGPPEVGWSGGESQLEFLRVRSGQVLDAVPHRLRECGLGGLDVTVTLGQEGLGVQQLRCEGDSHASVAVDLPGADGPDLLGPLDTSSQHRRHGVEREVRRATLEGQQLAVLGALPLREDAEQAEGPQDALGALHHAFGGLLVATLDRDVAERPDDETDDRPLPELGHRHEGHVVTLQGGGQDDRVSHRTMVTGHDDRLALSRDSLAVDDLDIEDLVLVQASQHQAERPGGHSCVNPRATRFGHLNSSGCTTFRLRLISPHR